MALFSVEHINIAGISAVVPKRIEKNSDLPSLSSSEKQQLIGAIGIIERRIADSNTTAVDLCIQAAQQILTALDWKLKEIDLLVFVTQTPDYTIPASAMYIQHRLGLSNHCIAFDINQGCAGYVYGLSVISSMMKAGNIKKGLLLVGDTLTKTIAKDDTSLIPVFSDAGSCTALEYDENSIMHFNLQSDGSGFDRIIIKNGGARNPVDTNRCLYMNGQDIFNFGLKEVVPNVEELLRYFGLEKSNADHFVMHQANILLNESIRKKLGFEMDQTFYSLEKYGNTSSATIPVSICANSENFHGSNMLFTGFGVGLSWGSAWIRSNQTKVLPINEY